MIGFLFSIIAGITMSVQGVFNTRLSEKIGTWQTNVFVQGTALILALFILLIFKGGDFSNIKQVNKLYLTGGILAVIITFTVMEGMKIIGITTAVATILVAQIVAAALIDCFGVFGTCPVKFDITKIIGFITMLVGIIIFKYKG
ncbi:MAG: DMT family transporter [Clostridiaceae bacterium]|nr:DMT family transporter [Clostridiaceae bacterium]